MLLPKNSQPMNITLRQRDKGRKISLYLDCYCNGKRSYEYLKIYLIKEPIGKRLSKLEHFANTQNLALAQSIRIKRIYEHENSKYLHKSLLPQNILLSELIISVKESTCQSASNLTVWNAMEKQLKNYCRKDFEARRLDIKFIEGFKNHLAGSRTVLSKDKLRVNTQSLYFEKFRMVLRWGCKSGVIPVDFSSFISGIKKLETFRDALDQNELKAFIEGTGLNNLVKESFIFMCVTGMRFGDASNLKAEDITRRPDGKIICRYRTEKTKTVETIALCNLAYKIIEKRIISGRKIFDGLNYSSYLNDQLEEYCKSIGIIKKIGFHSARHTFAQLHMRQGTDIYMISKLLGHKSVKTTQLYLRVSDELKFKTQLKIAM